MLSAIRRAAREHHIEVLANYETTWYASNRAAYEELAKGALGDVRRIVVHDGHEGPKEIGVQPEFLKWLEDPEQNGDGALYHFRLLCGSGHVAHARRVSDERHCGYADG